MNNFFSKVSQELRILWYESLSLRPLPNVAKIGHINFLIVTWFGVGLIKPMSATWGALAAIPFGYLITIFTGKLGLFFSICFLFYFSLAAIEKYHQQSGEHDDPSIVVDEVIGMWLAGILAGSDIFHWILTMHTAIIKWAVMLSIQTSPIGVEQNSV